MQRNVSLYMYHSCDSDSHLRKHFTSFRDLLQLQSQRQLSRIALYRIAPTNLQENRDTLHHRKKETQHKKHPNPTMSLAASRTSSPSHLHNTNIRVLPAPTSNSRQNPRTSLETAPPDIDNASEIPNPRTPQQAQDDGVYGYARSMRRVRQERHRDKHANDQKLEIDQFMFLISRDAKEGEKSECDDVRGANNSDDEEDTESQGESRAANDAEEEGNGGLLREVWRRAPGLLLVVLVSLMLTAVFVACQERWLPMMGLRAMGWL
jgi:hypothetical protein